MYEIPESEVQDYGQKWLEAERELVLNWVDIPVAPLNGEPRDNADRDSKRVSKALLLPRMLEDYQPGATQAHVLQALKRVAKSERPSQRHTRRPAPSS